MDFKAVKGGASAVDRHVGAAIALRRKAAGLTVDELAASMEVSPQQIQRYEAVAARVPASRLFDISQRLGAPVAELFREMKVEVGCDPAPVIALVRLVSSLSAARQQKILDMARTIARSQLLE